MIHKNPTSYQFEIALKLDIDISNDSRNVAGAKIYDVVQPAIDTNFEISEATVEQIKLGEKLGLNLNQDSMRVASAKIEDRLKEKNKNTLDKLNLKSGDKVIKKNKVNIQGEEKTFFSEHVVSSIGRNYRVYFKGGNGQGAWPTQLEKINSE